MKDNIDIEKLFSDKLANHESVVNSNIWSGIQSQIGAGISSTAVVTKGISTASKFIIGITSLVAVSTLAVILNYSESRQDSVVPNEVISDTTEMIADNPVLSAEDKLESNIVKGKDALVKESKEIISETIINSDLNKVPTPLKIDSPDKLIVKQQVAPILKDVPIYKNEQISISSKKSEVKAFNSESLSEPSISKGILQEWKKTNVFSPNNDGVNDLFFLETNDLKEFSITIINENNTVVFISDDPNFKWNGTDYKTGEMVPEGNYGYIVFAVDIYNTPFKLFNALKISR